ncbi:glycosyltransferase family 2 protein [Fibrobacter sp. UWB13]|uniref:glycosyltransferase family 2 protein n=1 Tax=Fibrobacter sp. UWB13 TaxID=1896204 RepID=UPI000A097DD8|nr:glycosyltransferase family 2 protein [Fibrobacter sp. UWB13]SMG16801.1 Glycosyltransferase involved in cell wall bisynthesis [Fibrobacter sp. UWB13]
MTKQPLLSICIPTWNRAKILSISLNSFCEQLASIDSSEIEIFVSDNASDDDTPQVVQSFIDQGLPITYNRNPENVGAAGNFIKCMQWASGKYIWLLGDDDLLKDGSISYILDLIRNGDYGLIHLSVLKNKDNLPETQEYSDCDDFWKAISFWVTFMSGSIFLKEAVHLVDNCERYIPTRLLQVPFYLMSSTLREKNLFVRKSVMQDGLDGSSNGGYNFYQVFVENYLNIWKEYVDKGIVSKKCYAFIKRDIYSKFIINYNCMLLLLHRNVKSENANNIGNRNGFKIKGAWKLLLKYYGHELYFWTLIPKQLAKTVLNFIRARMK